MRDFAGKQSTVLTSQASADAAGPGVGKRSLVEQANVAQAKADHAAGDAHAEGSGAHAAVPAGGGRPLPADVRAQMEHALGADFSAVRIHEGPEAAAMGAQAFTRGTDLFFAPGQYDPTSPKGQELLGHELTHVVQQGQGRVQATAQAKGLAVNDDAGLEHEADAMGAKAARGEQAHAGGGGGAVGGVVQRKGDVALNTRIAGLDAAAPRDAATNELIAQMADYDHNPDGRPAQQLAVLNMMVTTADELIARQPKPSAFAGFASKFSKPKPPTIAESLKAILVEERTIVQRQHARLERVTADHDAPYQQMTDEGMMWTHPDYEHNTERTGSTGKDYFTDMSAGNMASMADEKRAGGDAAPGAEAWFPEFVARAMAALSASRVNHYTTSTRAQAMSDGGGMKSKMMLEKDNPTFKHNTSGYDDLGLGNSGFLFFFIEPAGAPMRDTRFAAGDEGATRARISIPILESGLIERGWIMLSDFAQRETPDIHTNDANSAHASSLATREPPPGMPNRVRHFQQGGGPPSDGDMEKVTAPNTTPEYRQTVLSVATQVSGDAQSKQTYTGPARATPLEVSDRMLNNILVGGDIIPGLATRAALEVSRMAKVNPTLAATFKGLDGDALMRFMLKDLFRPQAMIPNTVRIAPGHIEAE